MDTRKPAIMIISTQTPNDSAGMNVIRPGGTGAKLQEVTGGAEVYVHRNKLPTASEIEIFQEYLQAGGWLIITGHGDVADQGIVGAYASSDGQERMDITVSANEYTNLILSSHALKPGDHLNILLYACCAGENINGKVYAQQLGQNLSTKGISTDIVASTRIVGRIGDYRKDWKDIEGVQLQFRAESNSVFVFSTAAASEGEFIATTSYEVYGKIFVTKEGVCFGEKRVSIAQLNEDTKLINAIIQLGFGIPKETLFKTLYFTEAEACARLRTTTDRIVFRKSSQEKHITATCLIKKSNEIVNLRDPVVDDGRGGLKIDMTEIQIRSLKNTTGLELEDRPFFRHAPRPASPTDKSASESQSESFSASQSLPKPSPK